LGELKVPSEEQTKRTLQPSVSCAEEDERFVTEEMAWRERRDREMRAPTSWLTIAGLFWLEQGENTFGSSRSNSIVLPEGSAPLFAGKFILTGEEVTVVANEGVPIRVGSKPVTQTTLKEESDYDPEGPDIVRIDNLHMWVIRRGTRFTIRLRDLDNPPYKNYKGLDFFPPTKKYKIQADFVPYPIARKATLETVVGIETEKIATGYVLFTIDKQTYRLESYQSPFNEENPLFFIFKDATNGRETYEASRFMECEFLAKGKVDLNFNRAYNPPCAYTSHAVCPLPPPQNHLRIRIQAGEKKYPGTTR